MKECVSRPRSGCERAASSAPGRRLERARHRGADRDHAAAARARARRWPRTVARRHSNVLAVQSVLRPSSSVRSGAKRARADMQRQPGRARCHARTAPRAGRHRNAGWRSALRPRPARAPRRSGSARGPPSSRRAANIGRQRHLRRAARRTSCAAIGSSISHNSPWRAEQRAPLRRRWRASCPAAPTCCRAAAPARARRPARAPATSRCGRRWACAPAAAPAPRACR